MHFVKSISVATVALFSFTSSAPLTSSTPLEKRGVVNVSLKHKGSGIVRATITNTGSEDVTFLKYGSILDDDPATRKMSISKDGEEVTFEGAMKNYHLVNLPDSAFITVHAGKSVTARADLALNHDLSKGGTYTVAAHGHMRLATSGKSGSNSRVSREIVKFDSNVLDIVIDGPEAARRMIKRTFVDNGSCPPERAQALNDALSNAAQLASAASDAALNGDPAKFEEYFMTTDPNARQIVSDRLAAIASEALSTDGGATTHFCDDHYEQCTDNVLAYTYPSRNTISNCNLYYETLPGLTNRCNDQDQATTTLHEFTHAPAVYNPNAVDYGYGYYAATSLDSEAAILNADSYALYANALYIGC